MRWFWDRYISKCPEFWANDTQGPLTGRGGPPTHHEKARNGPMASLTDQFETALSRIEPSDEDHNNAPEAHQDVRGVLREDDTLRDWGIDSVLIGSYKRHVSIRRVKDVDVFCRLDTVPHGVHPQDLLDRFYAILDDRYGDTAE